MQICVLGQIASSQVFTCEINRNEYEEIRFGGKEAVGDTHEMMIQTRRGRREKGRRWWKARREQRKLVQGTKEKGYRDGEWEREEGHGEEQKEVCVGGWETEEIEWVMGEKKISGEQVQYHSQSLQTRIFTLFSTRAFPRWWILRGAQLLSVTELNGSQVEEFLDLFWPSWLCNRWPANSRLCMFVFSVYNTIWACCWLLR